MGGKYVVFEDGSAVPFEYGIPHHNVVKDAGKVPVSAGFWDDGMTGIRCWGKSMTLNLIPKEGDAEKVSRALRKNEKN